MIYFLSDPHFGHNRVLEFCKDTRKFKSIEEHDAFILSSIQRTMTHDDELYILGDFTFSHDMTRNRQLFFSLPGRVHLIIGNHDKDEIINLPWASVSHYKEIWHKKTRYVLCHYPFKEGQWNGAHHGSIHLFGHVHGRPQYTMPVRAMDVGVDAIGMSPISIDRIHDKMMKINKFVPHHG